MGKTQLLLRNLKTLCGCVIKGERVGGVKAGKSLFLAPSKKLTTFIENTEKQGLGFDAYRQITPTEIQQYVEKLDKTVAGIKDATGKIQDKKSSFSYAEVTRWAQIYNETTETPVVDVVIGLRSPVKELFKAFF